MAQAGLMCRKALAWFVCYSYARSCQRASDLLPLGRLTSSVEHTDLGLLDQPLPQVHVSFKDNEIFTSIKEL